MMSIARVTSVTLRKLRQTRSDQENLGPGVSQVRIPRWIHAGTAFAQKWRVIFNPWDKNETIWTFDSSSNRHDRRTADGVRDVWMHDADR